MRCSTGLTLGLMPLWITSCGGAGPAPECETGEDSACFRGIYRSLTGSRVSDVETCAPELDSVSCVTSDSDGAWQIPGLPTDRDVLLTSTHPDYVSALFPQNTSMDWYDWYKTPVPLWIMDSHASRLGVELDESRGHLLFIAWEGLNIDGVDTDPVEGVEAVICPDSEWLFYANSLGLVSEDAQATSSLGQGGVLNLEPGTHQIQLTSPAGPCGVESMFHWAADDEGLISVPIRAGYTTAIDVICPVQ